MTDIDVDGPPSSRPLAAMFRHDLALDEATASTPLEVVVPVDDGIIVHVNGTEIGRENLPSGTIGLGSYALAPVRTNVERRVTFEVPPGTFVPGHNVITAQAHLNYRATPDLGFDLELRPVGSATTDEVDAGRAVPVPEGWRLVWSDEFEGAAPSPVWRRYHNTYGDGSRELQCYTPNNVAVGEGTMRIEARHEDIRCPQGTNLDRSYSSGFLGTRETGHYFPRYGRFEMRAKLPHGQGLWPAFWLRHRAGSSVAEVDVMEYFHSHLPGEYTVTLHLDGRSNVSKTSTPFERPTAAPGWNTYAVDIEPDARGVRFVFLLNGREVHRYVDTEHRWATRAPADGTWDLAVNLAVGGEWVGHPSGELGVLDLLGRCSLWNGGTPPSCRTDGIQRATFPATYEIDHVRVYTRL